MLVILRWDSDIPRLVSNAVAELCLGKALPFKDLGRVPLKGFEQPVHVHSLSLAQI